MYVRIDKYSCVDVKYYMKTKIKYIQKIFQNLYKKEFSRKTKEETYIVLIKNIRVVLHKNVYGCMYIQIILHRSQNKKIQKYLWMWQEDSGV